MNERKCFHDFGEYTLSNLQNYKDILGYENSLTEIIVLWQFGKIEQCVCIVNSMLNQIDACNKISK